MSSEKTTEELKIELQKAEERSQRFEGQLVDLQKKFENINPDEVVGLKEELRILRTEAERKQQQEDPEEWKKTTETTIRQTVQTELDDYKNQVTDLSKKLHELDVVETAFTQVRDLFVEKSDDYIRNEIRKTIDKDDTGLFVKDAEGKKRFASANKPFSVLDWGKEFAEKNPFFAKANVRGTMQQLKKEDKPTDPKVAQYLGAKTKEERLAIFNGNIVEMGNFITQNKLLNRN